MPTGDVLVTAKQAGVTLQVINPGVVTAATLCKRCGPAITVTLKHDGTNITETGTGLAAAINGSAPALHWWELLHKAVALVLRALWQQLRSDDGAINFTAPCKMGSPLKSSGQVRARYLRLLTTWVLRKLQSRLQPMQTVGLRLQLRRL